MTITTQDIKQIDVNEQAIKISLMALELTGLDKSDIQIKDGKAVVADHVDSVVAMRAEQKAKAISHAAFRILGEIDNSCVNIQAGKLLLSATDRGCVDV